jgi:rhodanese-related sulfurtransferase
VEREASRYKTRAYAAVSRIGQALASEKRLLILDLLAQAPRHVDAVADALSMPVANASQHLKVLAAAHLVESTREGARVVYRLAGDDVLDLWMTMLGVASGRLPEVERLDRDVGAEPSRTGAVEREAAAALVADGGALIIDVRPAAEFAAGHLPGALSIPLEELPQRIGEIPPGRPVIAYCRGRYCLSADEAVELLRGRGYDASRMEGGWPDWRQEGRPTRSGA